MKDFLHNISENSWIITPNNRLSQSLQHRYACTHPAAVFKPLHIFPYEGFLLRLFQQLMDSESGDHPRLLNNQQFHLLLGNILKEQELPFSNEPLCQQLIESWKRCENWEISIESHCFSSNYQTTLFFELVQETQKRLKQLNALAPIQIASYLKQHRLLLPCREILWYGFDDYTPQQQSLHHWLEQNGSANTFHDAEGAAVPLLCYSASTEQDEQQQWLAWLKKHRHQGKKLGVILPDLAKNAEAIQRLMRRHFTEEEFNISLGQTLRSYPLVAHALCLLSLDPNQLLENRQFRLLLHSSFIGEAQQEFHARARLLNQQNLMQYRTLSMKTFLNRCRIHAPLLCKRLEKLSSYPQTANPFEWAKYFDERLQCMGFPGESSLHSAAYQCYQRFVQALNEFRSLSLVQEEMTAVEALKQLHTVLQHIVFQPKANPAAYIHISGMLEASGIPFDGLWITGLTDLALPQALRYSPFIPISVQQQHRMPHASFEREQMLAEVILQRFQRTSGELICSYPHLRGEQTHLPSPLLAHAESYTPLKFSEQSPVLLEAWEDTYQLPLQEEEKIGGGTRLLANQAKCPFRALAAHRLHCENLVSEQDGLEKREQGTFIHQIMECIWQKLETQSRLLTLSDEECDALIAQSCDQVLKTYQLKAQDSIDAHTLNIERQRLARLAKECLALDKQRPPFSVIAIETESSWPLGFHTLRIKIDRLDQEENGNKWLIDYKSSIPVRIPWDKERPEEPQLILYALQDTDIKTISYLQLKSGDSKYKGLSHHVSEIAGISTPKQQSWNQCRENWQKALALLEQEFISGHCKPDPLRSEICATCEFGSLCRFSMRQTED